MTDRPSRVLFVDDDVGKRYAISRQLRHAGFVVDEAETGAQALAMISPEHDVAIVDLRLPDLDGWEVCRRIKAGETTGGVMVLELSATWATARDRAKGLDMGADAYLVHPVEIVELVATVNALARLRRAVHERDLDRELFVATVGHDLRNPLSAIGGSLEVLGMSKQLEPREREILNRACRNVGRMRRLIDQVMVFTQSLSGDMQIHDAVVDLAALCRATIAELDTPKVDLVVDQDPPFRGDPDRLTQLVENLVTNALRHGTGTVTVRLASEGDQAVVTVHNFGPTISAEAIPTLFEPYRRASSRPGGFGLGLFIVDRIARAHGGTVSVTSTDEAGTTFEVRLPQRP